MTTMQERRPASADRDYRMLIGGEWVEGRSGETFHCQDPFTEEQWGTMPVADEHDVDGRGA